MTGFSMSPSDRLSASLLCIIVLLAGALLLPHPASAQAELRVGIREGGNSATLLGSGRTRVATPPFSDMATLSRRPGLIIGGLAQLDPNGPLAFQSEALWIWKGLKATTSRGKVVTTLNYLEVPVLAKYRLPVSWKSITGHLLAGPTFGLVTQAERKQTTADAE
ncbi:MAG: outer membrane beta-barrel protein, partial [Candidatus Bipolaricaulia bacterium]